MDWQRNLLISAIVLVLALLFIRWNEFEAERKPVQESFVKQDVVIPEISANVSAPTGEQPEGSDDFAIPSLAATATSPAPKPEQDSRLITIRSDVLEVTIDTYGGDIVRTALLEYPETLKPGSDPFVILNRTENHTYIAQSGLIGPNGTDNKAERPLFQVQGNHFTLDSGEDELVVPLVYRQGDVTITKQFILRRGDYLMGVDYAIDNRSSSSWQGHLFGQIQRDTWQPPTGDGFGMQPYLGAAVTTAEKNYKKVTFSDLQDQPFTVSKTGGWVSMVQHYFISAWVPAQDQENSFTLRKLGSRDLYTLGFTSPQLTVPAGETGAIKAGFYVGPKDQPRLEAIAPYLDLTVDYGWLWWIAKPIFFVMTFIHGLVGNWGWTIILLTVCIKLLFFKLSATSYRSMAKMRKLQPEMARLKELYGDDRQKLSQEMMGFYKKEKVNPMGGCLPILIQMPVFIALYWVLFESVELRHAPWILWINDLSVKDPYYVLPVLNGISMYITTLLQPEPPDPTQAKVMKIMPVAFSFMFAFFPAGLVLYWTVNSVLSILQQWYITRRIEAGKG
ncbi:MAG: membrane protein insertase [Gammaproteobacteria bacterium BRH_c0]|nr:MAG: membrane protein insertase [Gammaproteobacteria bacterium BRH_c0]